MATSSTAGAPNLELEFVSTAPPVPLIAEHDTWITVDPILGCPADCTYCYLGSIGLRMTKPVSRATPEMLAAAFDDYLHGRRSLIIDPNNDQTPVCLGNYTDMVLAAGNRRLLVSYLKAIIGVLPTIRPLVVITKGSLDQELVAAVDDLRWPVYWIFSQSLAAHAGVKIEYGLIANVETTLANAKLVSTTRNQRSVHFWRPFVSETRLPRHRMAALLDELAGAGFSCSVVVGLIRGPGIPDEDQRLNSVLTESLATRPDHRELFDMTGWRQLREIAAQVEYPVYRSSSCAMALVSGRREQLATWRADLASQLCRPSYCPAGQRRRCSSQYPVVSESDIASTVSAFLQVSSSVITASPDDGILSVDAEVGEHDYNVLVHGLAASWDVRPSSVRREKAWLGVRGERFAR